MYAQRVAREFSGQCWSISASARDLYGVNWVRGERRAGLATMRGVVNTGSNSGYQILNLLYHFGVAKIVLLGYDFSRGAKSHWHGDHPKGLSNRASFGHWIPQMNTLAQHLAAAGVSVFNCTRKTALTCFPQRPLEWLK